MFRDLEWVRIQKGVGFGSRFETWVKVGLGFKTMVGFGSGYEMEVKVPNPNPDPDPRPES